MPTNSPTSTEQVIERAAREGAPAAWLRYDELKRDGQPIPNELCDLIAATLCTAKAALSRTPADSEVERARKLAAEIMVAMRQARFPKEYACEAQDEFEALTLTPMLLAALPPKPVDGEVAELVEELSNLSQWWGDEESEKHAQTVKKAADMLLALSRNTEPMVTDAMIEAGTCAMMEYPEGGEINIPDAVRDIYLAMVSAGKKGTDDAD